MIAENLSLVLKELPEHVQLVAVSKTKPSSFIVEAYDAGERHFGENKALEMRDKSLELAEDIKWHFIGHLQRNKVKYIIPSVHLIHSVDSFRLLQEINKEATKKDKVVNCLLQFHIAKETSKFGFSIEEANKVLTSEEFLLLKNINIIGVMGMATFSDDKKLVRSEFKTLKNIFEELKSTVFSEKNDFKEVSMGRSGDYLLAIEEGATIVRVGSSIFGNRT